jgi:hypothetical protein
VVLSSGGRGLMRLKIVGRQLPCIAEESDSNYELKRPARPAHSSWQVVISCSSALRDQTGKSISRYFGSGQ